jgi:GTPase SAR1 family protein
MISKKIMLLGEMGVGKTSLVRRYVMNEFSRDYKPTMGVDIYRRKITGLGEGGTQAVELVIWDIDGNFGQSIFKHVYSRGSSAALIVGDLTRAQTIDSMAELAQAFQENLPGRHFSLILNKSDACRMEDVSLPPSLSRYAAPLVTSALDGSNVEAAFRQAAEAIYRREA